LIKKLWVLSPGSLDAKTADDCIIALYYKSGKANAVKTYNTTSPDIYSDLTEIYPENTIKNGNK
jgi:hypothetical protein